MARGETDVACEKFRQSYEDEKALGPLLNHADCEEKRSRRVRALELWKLAVIATQPGTEERKFAEGRVADLVAILPKLAVRWAAEPPDGASVSLDGEPFVADGQAREVERGNHEVTGLTPSGTTRQTVQLAERESRTILLELPRIPPSGPASGPAASPQPGSEPGGSSGAWIAGWVVGGVGVAAAVGFGVTGGLILSKSSEWADAGCDARASSPDCQSIKPGTGLWVANGALLGAGLAGLGVGVILLATQWPDDSSHRDVALDAGPGDAGVGLRVRF